MSGRQIKKYIAVRAHHPNTALLTAIYYLRAKIFVWLCIYNLKEYIEYGI